MIENVKVEAFDDEGNSVGVYDSIYQASRKLFIKSRSTIYAYIFGAKTAHLKRKGGEWYHTKTVRFIILNL